MKAIAVRIFWFVVTTCMLIAAPLLFAATYKWVDEQGAVHYSQTPPPTQKFDVLREPHPVKEAPVKAAAPDKAATPASKETTKKTVVDDKESRETACLESRKRLAALHANPGRIMLKQDDGSMHRLTEEERQDYIKNTEADIEETCKDIP